jgi:hypothetical protein
MSVLAQQVLKHVLSWCPSTIQFWKPAVFFCTLCLTEGGSGVVNKNISEKNNSYLSAKSVAVMHFICLLRQ